MINLFRAFILLSLISVSFTARAFDVPALTGPVVDQVGLLSPRAKAIIEQNLYQAKTADGPQVQVLIINSLQGEEIEQVAIQVFDKWKLGDAKTSKAALFLIAPKEKKLRIEVGRGLEGDIPDVVGKRIIYDTVLPYFKTREFDMGIIQGVSAILHYAGVGGEIDADAAQGQAQSGDGEVHSSRLSGKLIGIIVFVLWILLFMFNPTLALALLFSGRGGGRGGGGFGGGGGGGWSGGGGSSAGGGASGSW